MQKEIALECAVEMVRDELQDGSVIPLTQYGKLANYLIAVKCVLKNPEIVDQCKLLMLDNLRKATQKDDKVIDRLKFHDSFSLWDDNQVHEYNEFIQEMSTTFQRDAFSCLAGEVPLTYLEKITELMCDNDSSVRQGRSFMEQVEVDKILLALETATAEQVSDFRRGLLSVYRIANIRDFLPNDKEALVKLQAGVQNLLACGKGADRVVRLQYSWLVSNIDDSLKNY